MTRITPPYLRGGKLHRTIITLFIFSIVFFILLNGSPTFLKYPEEIFRDWVLRTAAKTQHEREERVVVVDIDEDSLREIGPWPWPRNVVAELVENMVADYQVRAVAVDVVFPEPGEALGDEKLAVLSQFAPVVLSQVFDFSNRPAKLRVGELAGGNQLPHIEGTLQATGYIANHGGLAAAPYVGNIGFLPDQDGNLRRASFVVDFEGKSYPSLSLATARLADNLEVSPSMLEAQVRIPFVKPLNAYTVVPAHRVIEKTVNKEFLDNKVVFIGSSSLGLGDRVATPLNPQTSGVFAHVALYTGLLDGYPTRFQQSRVGTWLGTAWLLLVCGIAWARFDKQAATTNIGIVLFAALMWTGIAGWLALHFAEASLGAPFLALLGLLLLLVPYDWQTSQNRSKFLIKTLKHHISPDLVRELIDSGDPNPLKPRRSTITVLVADVENYTGKIAGLPTEEIAELTRDILNLIGQSVMQMRGTVDKFTGDGGVAFWGAPLAMDNHADLALQACVEILESVKRYNHEQEANGQPKVRVRLGVDSGEVIVGDFGWQERAIYTAMGQCMGRAARFEELGKTYAEDLIVGANTVELSRTFAFERIGSPTLRGLDQTVDIFRVVTPASK